jgi:hypothetical protein
MSSWAGHDGRRVVNDVVMLVTILVREQTHGVGDVYFLAISERWVMYHVASGRLLLTRRLSLLGTCC